MGVTEIVFIAIVAVALGGCLAYSIYETKRKK